MAYTHIVRRRSRGGDGKWFDYPGRGYNSADEALVAGRAAAAKTNAVRGKSSGIEYDVVARKGNRTIATFRLCGEAGVKMVDWRVGANRGIEI